MGPATNRRYMRRPEGAWSPRGIVSGVCLANLGIHRNTASHNAVCRRSPGYISLHPRCLRLLRLPYRTQPNPGGRAWATWAVVPSRLDVPQFDAWASQNIGIDLVVALVFMGVCALCLVWRAWRGEVRKGIFLADFQVRSLQMYRDFDLELLPLFFLECFGVHVQRRGPEPLRIRMIGDAYHVSRALIFLLNFVNGDFTVYGARWPSGRSRRIPAPSGAASSATSVVTTLLCQGSYKMRSCFRAFHWELRVLLKVISDEHGIDSTGTYHGKAQALANSVRAPPCARASVSGQWQLPMAPLSWRPLSGRRSRRSPRGEP